MFLLNLVSSGVFQYYNQIQVNLHHRNMDSSCWKGPFKVIQSKSPAMHRDINSIYQVAQNPQLDFDCFQGWCIYQPLSVFHLSLKHVLLTTSLNLLSFCLKPSSLILSQKAFQIITLEFKWILLKKFYSSRQDILCLSKV